MTTEASERHDLSIAEASVHRALYLRELGIGIVAYSPLGPGFLTGRFRSADSFGEGDFRGLAQPSFADGNLQHNLAIVDVLEKLAAERGVTAGQLALAWVGHQGEDVVPIPGTKRREYLEQNVAKGPVSP